MTPKYYEVVPVSDHPPKNGWYTVYAGDEFLGQDWFEDGKFNHKPATHWLREVSSLPIDREQAEKIFEAGADAALEAVRLNGESGGRIYHKEKLEYLKQFV